MLSKINIKSLIFQIPHYYKFCTESDKANNYNNSTFVTSQSRVYNYYRNLARIIKLNSKNGHAKLSEKHLIEIIRLTKQHQETEIMFEAYYNFHGHFTLVSNKVVDSLLLKAIQHNIKLSFILQLLSHHTYLGYYPSYEVTNQIINYIFINGNKQQSKKLLDILLICPLIKLNKQNIDLLVQLVDRLQQLYPMLIKLLIRRSSLVSQFVSATSILQKIIHIIKSCKCNKNFKYPFKKYEQFREQLLNDNSLVKSTIIFLAILDIIMNKALKSAQLLKQRVNIIDQNCQEYFIFVKKICDDSLIQHIISIFQEHQNYQFIKQSLTKQ